MNITYKRNFLIYGIFFSFISLFPESKSKENWKLDMKQSSIQFYVKAKVENVKGTLVTPERSRGLVAWLLGERP